MKDITEEIKSLGMEGAEEYDLIAVKAVKRWITFELDNIHESKVYALMLTYSVGTDEHGAAFPKAELGYNSEAALQKSGAEKYDTDKFMEKSMSVMDDFGAIDMWMELKGYDMNKDAEKVLRLLGEAVRGMHEDGSIKERFARKVPVIMVGDVSRDILDEINSKANGEY